MTFNKISVSLFVVAMIVSPFLSLAQHYESIDLIIKDLRSEEIEVVHLSPQCWIAALEKIIPKMATKTTGNTERSYNHLSPSEKFCSSLGHELQKELAFELLLCDVADNLSILPPNCTSISNCLPTLNLHERSFLNQYVFYVKERCNRLTEELSNQQKKELITSTFSKMEEMRELNEKITKEMGEQISLVATAFEQIDTMRESNEELINAMTQQKALVDSSFQQMNSMKMTNEKMISGMKKQETLVSTSLQQMDVMSVFNKQILSDLSDQKKMLDKFTDFSSKVGNGYNESLKFAHELQDVLTTIGGSTFGCITSKSALRFMCIILFCVMAGLLSIRRFGRASVLVAFLATMEITFEVCVCKICTKQSVCFFVGDFVLSMFRSWTLRLYCAIYLFHIMSSFKKKDQRQLEDEHDNLNPRCKDVTLECNRLIHQMRKEHELSMREYDSMMRQLISSQHQKPRQEQPMVYIPLRSTNDNNISLGTEEALSHFDRNLISFRNGDVQEGSTIRNENESLDKGNKEEDMTNLRGVIVSGNIVSPDKKRKDHDKSLLIAEATSPKKRKCKEN